MADLNAKRVGEIAGKVFEDLGGSLKTSLTWLGENLGLYREMNGAGPLTSDGLAKRLNLSERWVREWLHGQAAAVFVDDQGDGQFERSPEAAGSRIP